MRARLYQFESQLRTVGVSNWVISIMTIKDMTKVKRKFLISFCMNILFPLGVTWRAGKKKLKKSDRILNLYEGIRHEVAIKMHANKISILLILRGD